MSIPISVTFETVSVSFVGFTRNLGLTGLKKRGAGLLILSSLLSLRFFGYSPMWRAGPHCLIVIAAPNDISAVCSHKLCPLVAALICNHLPFDSAKVSTSGALYSTTQFPTEKPKPIPVLAASALPCSAGATCLLSPLQLYPKKSPELVTQRHACRLCGGGKGKACYSFEFPKKLTFISKQIFLPCK